LELEVLMPERKAALLNETLVRAAYSKIFHRQEIVAHVLCLAV
jgi:hypothetical protein